MSVEPYDNSNEMRPLISEGPQSRKNVVYLREQIAEGRALNEILLTEGDLFVGPVNLYRRKDGAIESSRLGIMNPTDREMNLPADQYSHQTFDNVSDMAKTLPPKETDLVCQQLEARLR